MDSRTRVSAKGQVVIPKAVRDERGWDVGTELRVESAHGAVVLRTIKPSRKRKRGVPELLGIAGYRGPRRSLDDMERAVRGRFGRAT